MSWLGAMQVCGVRLRRAVAPWLARVYALGEGVSGEMGLLD